MKIADIDSLSPMERRRFLKWAAAALAAPWVAPSVRMACQEILFGQEALAAGPPINFIEIYVRRQFDFLHIMVPPGIATDSGLRRADGSAVAAPLYFGMNELRRYGATTYLTPD